MKFLGYLNKVRYSYKLTHKIFIYVLFLIELEFFLLSLNQKLLDVNFNWQDFFFFFSYETCTQICLIWRNLTFLEFLADQK